MGSTQLWVGKDDLLIEKVYAYAIDIFGVEKQNLIRTRQFYGILWLSPQKNQYTRADLEQLFEKTAFALNESENFIVVVQYADLLSGVCANSLLKLLEEPGRGYHFILLTDHRDGVIATIQSRALITEYFGPEAAHQYEPFLALFKNLTQGNHVQVMQELEKIKMTESQARRSLDQIYHYWVDQYKEALTNGDGERAKKSDRMMRVCAHAIESPPMPGSVKLFWKNIYLLMSL